MKLVTKTLIAGMLMAGFAGAANAADTGWYLGAGVGAGKNSVDVKNDMNYREHTNATGYKVYGGYQLNKNFALELQYADLGSYKRRKPGASFESKTAAISFSGVGFLPLTESFSLLGKVGVAAQNVKTTTTGIGYTANDGNNTAILLGAGAEYHFNSNLTARVEYEYIGSSNVKNNLVSAGLRYSF